MSNFISDREFAQRTFAWQELEGKRQDSFNFFYADNGLGLLMRGITLAPNDVENLFSRTSVKLIKIRFGLDIQEKTTYFNIILYGTDEAGEVLTPYYIHESYNWDDVSKAGAPDDGNIPDALAKLWKRHWIEKGMRHEINSQLFMTHYGFIRGYSYPLKELYGALFNFKELPVIRIHLVLHKYHPLERDKNLGIESDEAYTFGVFFQGVGVKLGNEYLGEAPDDKSGYYDLSAPCPRTC